VLEEFRVFIDDVEVTLLELHADFKETKETVEFVSGDSNI